MIVAPLPVWIASSEPLIVRAPVVAPPVSSPTVVAVRPRGALRHPLLVIPAPVTVAVRGRWGPVVLRRHPRTRTRRLHRHAAKRDTGRCGERYRCQSRTDERAHNRPSHGEPADDSAGRYEASRF